jgi:2,3-bisphosphoglycerate-independent phosphoglycerate mutase
MDRDERRDRIQKSYNAIVKAEGESFTDIVSSLQDCYAKDETDEFIVPKVVEGYTGVKKHDSFIFYNFRTDRTRELTRAMIDAEFHGRERKPLDIYFVAMTEFYKPMRAHAAFADISMDNLLGEVISKAWLQQLRISETEKYAHVTFFFNGQIETVLPGEERILIHSPKVATYEGTPEMSAYEITDKLTKELTKETYDFIVVNIVNGDLIWHTWIAESCRKAVEIVDSCVEKIVTQALEHKYTTILTADHGNIEDQTAERRTSHTTNPVPCILISNDTQLQKVSLKEGKWLADIAPTILALMDIAKPKEMTGESLIN